MSAKGAPHDGQDTVKTLRTIIWYKRACIRHTTQRPFVAVQPLKKDVKENFIIDEQIELQAKLLNYFLGSNKSNINQSTSSEPENSFLEINHITNMTTGLNETAASGWGSRRLRLARRP